MQNLLGGKSVHWTEDKNFGAAATDLARIEDFSVMFRSGMRKSRLWFTLFFRKMGSTERKTTQFKSSG